VFGNLTTPTAELDSRGSQRPRWAATVLSALVTAASILVVLAARPVGADQITSLQAQAASVAQKLVQEQLEVNADQQLYSVASARVATDDQAIATLNQQMNATEQAITARSSEIRSQAIRSYVDEGDGSSATALFTGSVDRVQEASEYQSIAVGNITTQLDRLHTAQRSLQSERAALAAREAADRAGQNQQASALSEANATTQQLSAVQAQVTGQLATAVAAAQAAQQAAAAAAVAQAQQAAAARAVSVTAPSPGPTTGSSAVPAGPAAGGNPSAGAGLVDPPLPPFLQCVVQAESGGDYGAVSPNGEYMGAFQFSQSTWNVAAQAAGLSYLVGVPPNQATKAEQDTVAVTLYRLDGERPWLGDRCSS
jgi:Transglycosylase-like domain